MPVTVHCQKCGTENRLGQLFCRECGAKLDLSQLKPGSKLKKESLGSGALIARIVRIAVSLVLLAILGLLCWPAPKRGDAPTHNGTAIVQQKMSALRGAILRNNDVTDVFSEADINAHLNARLITGRGDGFHLVAKEIRLDLSPGEVHVWLKSTLGPLPITYSTTVAGNTNGPGGKIHFRPGQTYIGKLPAMGPLRGRVFEQLSGMFLILQDEIALLNRLAEIQIIEGGVVASTLTTSTTRGEP